MMKRPGQPAGEDFEDNRVPGGDQRFGSLTINPELDNQLRHCPPYFYPEPGH